VRGDAMPQCNRVPLPEFETMPLALGLAVLRASQPGVQDLAESPSLPSEVGFDLESKIKALGINKFRFRRP
jgi:hypothetical protein